jgi:hypothetical protein
MNPTNGAGIADANITSHRFVLLEFDSLPLGLQAAVFACLPLPTFCILTSGGRSLHAWIRVDAVDADNYRELAQGIFRELKPLGVDPSNKNPSRLSRLPGVQRKHGAAGDGRQRLLYLNPNAKAWEPIL